MRMIVESMMECRLTGETEVLGENLPEPTLVHHKIPRAHPGLNAGRRGGKPATNRLIYGAAKTYLRTPASHRCSNELDSVSTRVMKFIVFWDVTPYILVKRY
jgi:hypothetical protein